MELLEKTIPDLQADMAAGRYTAQQLVTFYLTRIEQLDRQGPAVNSVIEINPDALRIAADLDRERQESGPRGLLHGIPVLLKDNIDTADSLQTSGGSLALVGTPAPRDAFLVERLRQAGAVLLGKTNLSEWANFRSRHSTSGWSSRGGQTRHPYYLDRNPCGSSSGSAVAVSANFCAAAIGTETDGSIVCPAHINGIVGLKPTLGVISRSGIIPIAHSQDTAGPMTRTVTDAAILLGAMTGVDPRDPETAVCATNGPVYSDYTPFLRPDGLRGARLGVMRHLFEMNTAVVTLLHHCLEILRTAGATVLDPLPANDAEYVGKTEFEVLLYEFKADLNAYLATRGPGVPVSSLSELIAFNEAHRDKVMPFFAQEHLLQADTKGPLTDETYLEALATNHRLTRTEGIDALRQAYELDALIAPTGGPAWMTDWVNGDHYLGSSSTLAAVAGYPHITVPAGFVHGLPIGLSFFAGAYQEPRLLELAFAFEQMAQARRMPHFLPTMPG